MEASQFQFSNPILIDSIFKINEEYEGEDINYNDIPVSFDIEVMKHEKNPEALVQLKVEVGEKGDKYPFYALATEGAHFRWNSDEIQNPNIFLEQNAPALLLSYLRPIIANLTAASICDAYNLPFINFSKREEDTI